MEVDLNRIESITVLTLKGRADATNAAKLEAVCDQLIENKEINLLIDCTNLDYISSAALRVLLKMGKQIKKVSGTLAVAHLNAHVQQIFEISGFLSLFPAYATMLDALAHLKKPAVSSNGRPVSEKIK